ncbi:MAG: hypothetical protein QHH12_02525 [Candidatus Bathyarchaeota archaeon]|jgi:hypothetical protein|nr:hypothetical protein [Candidatus Bathyarchaeota archaeon A05DMB-3]MDH7606631.1 hypothetical protein [Candidatus Bathyarchaeota archaeon]
MVEEEKSSKSVAKKFAFKALKAFLKSFLFYILYLFVWSFLAPITEFVPGLQQTVENFVIVYIALGVLGDLVADTVFQYFFSTAKALFVIGYLALTLNGGMLNLTYRNIALTVDLRLFLMVAILLSLLGLAKSMLQAISYMNKKAEFGFKT